MAMVPHNTYFHHNHEQDAEQRQHEMLSRHDNAFMGLEHMNHFSPQACLPNAFDRAGKFMVDGPVARNLYNASLWPLTPPLDCHLLPQRPTFKKPADISTYHCRLSVDTGCLGREALPATPPLSISGDSNSSTGSPPLTSKFLPTPTDFTLLHPGNMEGVKEGCEGEVTSEMVAMAEWTRCGTPPLAPGKLLLQSSHFLFTDKSVFLGCCDVEGTQLMEERSRYYMLRKMWKGAPNQASLRAHENPANHFFPWCQCSSTPPR